MTISDPHKVAIISAVIAVFALVGTLFNYLMSERERIAKLESYEKGADVWVKQLIEERRLRLNDLEKRVSNIERIIGNQIDKK